MQQKSHWAIPRAVFCVSHIKEAGIDLLKRGEISIRRCLPIVRRGERLSRDRKRGLRERCSSDTYRRVAQKMTAAPSPPPFNVHFHNFVLVSTGLNFTVGIVANPALTPNSENLVVGGQIKTEDSPATGS